MARVYSYKLNRSLCGLSAQEVGEELDRLASANGGELTPPRLVEVSRPKSALFHEHFEWNDKTAASEWRLHQARNIINIVEVQIAESTPSAPAFVSIAVIDDGEQEDSATRSYLPIETVMDNEPARERYVDSLKRRLANLRRQYASVRELASVWEAIDKTCQPEAA